MKDALDTLAHAVVALLGAVALYLYPWAAFVVTTITSLAYLRERLQMLRTGDTSFGPRRRFEVATFAAVSATTVALLEVFT